MHAFGCSLDYCQTFVYMTGGYLHTFGCHYERTEAKEANHHPFKIFGETEFHIYAGYIQLNDFVEPTVQTHVFHLGQQRTRLFLRDVRAWGLKTASDEMVSGEGQVVGLLTGIGGGTFRRSSSGTRPTTSCRRPATCRTARSTGTSRSSEGDGRTASPRTSSRRG